MADKLRSVKDATLLPRLRSAPKRGKIPLMGYKSTEQLSHLNLIVHPNELGIDFVPYKEVQAKGEKFLYPFPRNPSYEEFDPNTQSFFTAQETIRLDAVRHYIEHPDMMFGISVDMEPTLFQFSDGTILILDGNHRIAAAKLAGRTVTVCMISTERENA